MLILVMFKRITIILLLISMALSLYSTEMVMVITDEGEKICVTDVCSQESQASFMTAPMVPAPIFVFVFERPYEHIDMNESINFASVYLPLIDKPPVI